MSAYAQWFDSLGKCGGCGKSATGYLRGPSNQNLGHYCTPCANRLIKAAHRKHKQFLPDAEIDYRRKVEAVSRPDAVKP